MQGHNQQFGNSGRSMQGGALQAAYLEKAAKRNEGLFQRIMGRSCPSSGMVQPVNDSTRVKALGKTTPVMSHKLTSQDKHEGTRTTVSREVFDAEFLNAESINRRWKSAIPRRRILETTPPSDMTLSERRMNQEDDQVPLGPKSPADLQSKYIEGVLQSTSNTAPKSTNLQSHSCPIKEFGLQQRFTNGTFETQSGLLQASILEQVLKKQPPAKGKPRWLS